MVDFTLTEKDRHILGIQLEDEQTVLKYARYYDQHHDELQPEELPEAAGRPNPYELAHSEEGTSGGVLTEALLHFHTPDVRMRITRSGLGDKIVNYGGTPEQKARWGHKTLSIAITEPGAGSDPMMITGKARYDAATDEWILNGEKIYCSQFGMADGAVVMLRGEPDANNIRPFLSFVVEKGTKGLQVLGQVDKMGCRNWDTADFVLQDCRVPAINKLDVDFGGALQVFNGTRPMVAAMGMKYARSIMDVVVAKLAEQGQAIDYGTNAHGRSAVQEKVLGMEAEYEAARLVVLHSKWTEQNEGNASKATMKEAAEAKAIGGRASRRISQEALALLGPSALSEEEFPEKWFRDARIFDIFEGPGDICRLIVARHILGYSKRELS
jgi:acyl-CoA dehydrogenase